MKLAFLPVEALRRTEEHDPARVVQLAEAIFAQGSWSEPILVHRNNLAILDGHHRREAALKLELSVIPSLLCCYDEDGIELKGWRDGEHPAREDVFKAALTGRLLPYKTTRHIVPASPIEFAIPLNLLRSHRESADSMFGLPSLRPPAVCAAEGLRGIG